MYAKGQVYAADMQGKVIAVQFAEDVFPAEDNVRVPEHSGPAVLGMDCAVEMEPVEGEEDTFALKLSGSPHVKLIGHQIISDEQLENFLKAGEVVFSLKYTVGDIMEELSNSFSEEQAQNYEFAKEVGEELWDYDSIWEKIDDCIYHEANWQLNQQNNENQGQQPQG